MVELKKEGFNANLGWDNVKKKPKLFTNATDSIPIEFPDPDPDPDPDLDPDIDTGQMTHYKELKKYIEDPYDIIIEPIDVESIPLDGKCKDKYPSICKFLLDENHTCDIDLNRSIIDSVIKKFPTIGPLFKKHVNDVSPIIYPDGGEGGTGGGGVGGENYGGEGGMVGGSGGTDGEKYGRKPTIKYFCCRECMIRDL